MKVHHGHRSNGIMGLIHGILRWMVPCAIVICFTLQQYVLCPAGTDVSFYTGAMATLGEAVMNQDEPAVKAAKTGTAEAAAGATNNDSRPASLVPWMAFEDGAGQYLLREPSLWRELGASLTQDQLTTISKKLERELCKNVGDIEKCSNEMEVQRSLLGSTGSKAWYSAASPSVGAVFAKVDERKLALDYVHTADTSYKQMDIVVPLKGTDRVEKVAWFATNFAEAVKPFVAKGMKFRLLVSLYEDDKHLFDKENLSSKAGDIEVVIIQCENKATKLGFNRASCVNCLLADACIGDDCLVALMDVDLQVSEPFISNAMAYTAPQKTLYFPIFFSEFNPEKIALVEQAREQEKSLKRLQWAIGENYKGIWREDSTGMWVMAGSDATKLHMDESFEGWGGEDKAFHEELTQRFNIVRVQDSGLFHKFHSKDCKVGEFVDESQAPACISSALKQEGTVLSIYMDWLRKQEAQQQ